jgi:uroporphyrinogen-III synthase
VKLLSTKILTHQQQLFLEKAGCQVTAYDAIQIRPIPFEAPNKIENAIFTSKHAVEAVSDKKINIKQCFCVGPKTSEVLVENGRKVQFIAKNASELAKFITKYHQNDTFYIFSGSLSLNTIPSELKKAKISYFDVKTYKTELNLMKFDDIFEKILFFSPSGVQSFTHFNTLKNSSAICIGETTATEAKKHTNNVSVAQDTTIESVLESAIKSTIHD